MCPCRRRSRRRHEPRLRRIWLRSLTQRCAHGYLASSSRRPRRRRGVPSCGSLRELRARRLAPTSWCSPWSVRWMGLSQEAIAQPVAVDRGSLSRLVRDLEYEGLHRARTAADAGRAPGSDVLGDADRRGHAPPTRLGRRCTRPASGGSTNCTADGARSARRSERRRPALDRRDRVVLGRPGAVA